MIIAPPPWVLLLQAKLLKERVAALEAELNEATGLALSLRLHLEAAQRVGYWRSTHAALHALHCAALCCAMLCFQMRESRTGRPTDAWSVASPLPPT